MGSILLLFKLLLPEPRKTKKKRLARKVRQSAALARRVPEKKLTETEQIK
ncbi:MAG: hypothetical protein IID18_10635 [Nitrospinae bacterium]|nr:hypothetical protein [Nitrospinota bacterium]